MLQEILFNLAVFITFLIYYSKNRDKARQALVLLYKSIRKIYPLILIMMFLFVFLQKLSIEGMITGYIEASSGYLGYLSAAVAGSIFHIPHFIAFPIGGQLLQTGVNPGFIAVFISSLVMVHIFSIPIEIKFLGVKFAVIRNGLSFMFSIIIGIIFGVLY